MTDASTPIRGTQIWNGTVLPAAERFGVLQRIGFAAAGFFVDGGDGREVPGDSDAALGLGLGGVGGNAEGWSSEP